MLYPVLLRPIVIVCPSAHGHYHPPYGSSSSTSTATGTATGTDTGAHTRGGLYPWAVHAAAPLRAPFTLLFLFFLRAFLLLPLLDVDVLAALLAALVGRTGDVLPEASARETQLSLNTGWSGGLCCG